MTQAESNNPEWNGLVQIAASMRASAQRPLLVLVDQFEEIYTLCKDPKQQAAFIGNLLGAARDPQMLVFVIITLRSDFLQETQTHPELNQVIAQHNAFIPAMHEDGLRRAIQEPARLAHHALDNATVALLIEQSKGREGVLPLLQFALTEIWKGLEAGIPEAKSLENLGGVGGALAKCAQDLYESLPQREQTLARRIFLGLIHLGEGARDTRRRSGVEAMLADDESAETLRRVLDKLSRKESRLITLSDEHGHTQAEITHETLLDHWTLLKDWLATSREHLRFARPSE